MSSDEAPRSIRKEAISSPGQGSRKRGITATENTNTTADTEKRQKKEKIDGPEKRLSKMAKCL